MSGIPCDARGCRAVATQQRTTTIATGGYDGPIAREVQTDLCDAHAAEHDAQEMARSLVEGRVPDAPSAGMAREANAFDDLPAIVPPESDSFVGWRKPKTHAERTATENLNHLAGRVIHALDGCNYCRMHMCNAPAHRDLKEALFAATGIEYVPYAERLNAARQG